MRLRKPPHVLSFRSGKTLHLPRLFHLFRPNVLPSPSLTMSSTQLTPQPNQGEIRGPGLRGLAGGPRDGRGRGGGAGLVAQEDQCPRFRFRERGLSGQGQAGAFEGSRGVIRTESNAERRRGRRFEKEKYSFLFPCSTLSHSTSSSNSNSFSLSNLGPRSPPSGPAGSRPSGSIQQQEEEQVQGPAQG